MSDVIVVAKGYTKRQYRGFVITHLTGTLTFKAYDSAGNLRACKSKLRDVKRAVDKILDSEEA